MVDAPFSRAIVPGADLMSAEQHSCTVFGGKDGCHIDQTPKNHRNTGELSADRGDQSGTAVDWEHPDGGDSL